VTQSTTPRTNTSRSRLSPQAVQQSGGEANYRRFWGTVERVIVRDVRRSDPSTGTVTGKVTFIYNNGDPTETDQPYTWNIAVDGNGKAIMQSFSNS